MMRRAAAGVAVVALVLSGCDGGNGDDAGASTGPITSTTRAVDDDASTRPPSTSTVTSPGGDTGPPPSAPPTTVPDPVPGPTNDVALPVDVDGGRTLGPLGSTDVELTSEDGSVQIGSADLPGLADGFPLPEGTELELASETSTAAGFSGVAPGSVLEQADFYRESLPAAGFSISAERRPSGDDDPDPSVVLFTFASDDREGELAITSAPGGGGASIIVAIAER